MKLLVIGVLSPALLAPLSSVAQQPASPAEKAKVVCEDVASNVHACAKEVREAVRVAPTLDEIFKVSGYWSARYDTQVVNMRSGPVGVVKAKSDMQMIREEITGEVEGQLKDKVTDAIAKQTIPGSWRDAWNKFWSKYLKRVSAFTSHAATKGVLAALRASMPSQIATDYDELELSNKGVGDAVSSRVGQLVPTPTAAQTAISNAYQMAADRLGPKLQAAPASAPRLP